MATHTHQAKRGWNGADRGFREDSIYSVCSLLFFKPASSLYVLRLAAKKRLSVFAGFALRSFLGCKWDVPCKIVLLALPQGPGIEPRLHGSLFLCFMPVVDDIYLLEWFGTKECILTFVCMVLVLPMQSRQPFFKAFWNCSMHEVRIWSIEARGDDNTHNHYQTSTQLLLLNASENNSTRPMVPLL